MTHKALKLTIGGVIFASALGYLAFAGMQKGWVYTLSVDQFLGDVKYKGERVRLCGIVLEKNLARKGDLDVEFLIKGEARELPVRFHGVVSPMFQAGTEVLVEGKLDGQNVFVADTMMTKCASKYEEKPKDHDARKAAAGS